MAERLDLTTVSSPGELLRRSGASLQGVSIADLAGLIAGLDPGEASALATALVSNPDAVTARHAVDDGRYAPIVETVAMYPGEMSTAGIGTTTLTHYNRCPVVVFPHASNANTGVNLQLPTHWATFNIVGEFCTAAVNSADVTFQPGAAFFAPGDALVIPPSLGSVTWNPDGLAQYEIEEVTLGSGITNVPGETLIVNVLRLGAGDASTTDCGLVRIKFVKAS